MLLAYAIQKKLDMMGIENEIINFMPQEKSENGEIPSAHAEEKVSSPQKIRNYDDFRKKYLRLTREYIGISDVDELDFDTYLLGAFHLYLGYGRYGSICFNRHHIHHQFINLILLDIH